MKINKILITALLSTICYSSFAQNSSELLQSVQKNPDDANLSFQYGISLIKENKNSEAISVFEKLLEKNPQSPSLYNNLAVLYANQQQFDKTEELLKNAIKIAPDYSTAYENLADLYAKLSTVNYQKAYKISENDFLLKRIDGINKVLLLPKDNNQSDKKVVAPKNNEVANNLPTSLPNQTLKSIDNSNSNTLEITEFLNSWKESWENKDLTQFFSFYDSSFYVDSSSHDEWVKIKSKNISNQKNIHIELYNIETKSLNNEIVVSFVQKYKSRNVHSKDRMSFVIKKVDSHWKFIRKIK